jgi:hypothetical protein
MLPICGLYEVAIPVKDLATVQGPVSHAWMPAMSVYFTDPAGHQLALCAPTHTP